MMSAKIATIVVFVKIATIVIVVLFVIMRGWVINNTHTSLKVSA